MKIQLSDHFTTKKLLQFVFPTVLMILCTSIYGIVDGYFVSNFVGKTAFAAVNLIMPLIMGVSNLGFMFGSGGNAIVARLMGEGKDKAADRLFTMVVYAAFICGFIVSALCFVFIRPIAMTFGAEGELLEQCIIYGRISFCSMPAYILQCMFQNLLVTAEKPKLALKIIVTAGIANMLLDFLFIGIFHWGIAGAAAATAISEYLGGFLPIAFFLWKNDSRLHLVKTSFQGRSLLNTCINGSSEMVTSLSTSTVNVLYNLQLMRLTGEDGIAAYGIIMYVNIIFIAIHTGYSVGHAPIVSYHYGAGDHAELKNMFKKSIIIISCAGIIQFAVAQLLAVPLVMIFASYDPVLLSMTVHGFRAYALAFLLMGFNVWGSAFFTALNNGPVSAAISFLRTLVFQVIVILLLPHFFGLNGIWFSYVAAEGMAALVTTIFLVTGRKKYHYA